MIKNLPPLRVILVSKSAADHDLFRQAAVGSKVPIRFQAERDSAAACRAVAGAADLVFLDAELPDTELAPAMAAAHGAAKPPFTVLLATSPAARPDATDAVALKPARRDEARQLMERSIRVRTPSRVLVVDDSSTMRGIVRKTLAATRFPFDVVEAAEGFAAIKLAGATDIDIVFLDYNMPGFNGLQTLTELKRDKHRMSVVVMTSMQDETLAAHVRAAGAAFLKKPFFPADIEAALTSHYGFVALNPKRA
jgi:CheY-like chemotaxis protein